MSRVILLYGLMVLLLRVVMVLVGSLLLLKIHHLRRHSSATRNAVEARVVALLMIRSVHGAKKLLCRSQC